MFVPTPMSRFNGVNALILGGGADGPRSESEQIAIGNGRAIAMRLAAEGASVAVVDLNLESAKETLSYCGGNGVAIQADLGNSEDCQSLVDQARKSLGPIDVVVANAAVSASFSLKHQTIEDWDLNVNVNVRGHWQVAQNLIVEMVERSKGCFVFVGSTAGVLSSGRSLAYEATKASQLAVMRHIAVKYGRNGIRSNAVVLGVIDSTMVRREFGSDPKAVQSRDSISPMKRQGKPEEVAGAAAFLASSDASYVNGHSLVVDGGVSASWPTPITSLRN